MDCTACTAEEFRAHAVLPSAESIAERCFVHIKEKLDGTLDGILRMTQAGHVVRQQRTPRIDWTGPAPDSMVLRKLPPPLHAAVLLALEAKLRAHYETTRHFRLTFGTKIPAMALEGWESDEERMEVSLTW